MNLARKGGGAPPGWEKGGETFSRALIGILFNKRFWVT
jgi:hypothetical protein